MRIAPTTRRPGLTLLEVLVSLAIFLMFLTGITQLLNVCTSLAMDVQNVNRASQLLQSQMNRVISGEVSLSSQGESTIGDDQNDTSWTWSMDCQQESTPNLWNVTITVKHSSGQGGEDESWTLHQLIVDPAARGAIQSSSSSSSGSSSPGSPSSPTTAGGGP